MKRMSYYQYLESSEWRLKSNAAKERAGYRCQLCNVSDTPNNLHAHHRTYKRLGHEDDMDLTVLCHKCHKWFHQWHKMMNDGQSMIPLCVIALVEEIPQKPDGDEVL